MSAATTNNGFVRVSRQSPCPVCGKPDHCTVSRDGVVAKCTRVADGAFKTSEDGAGLGYFHRVDESTADRIASYARTQADTPAPTIDADGIAKRCYEACGFNGRASLASQLGVTVTAVNALRAGFSDEHKAYTFPMRDHTGRVIGIRLRNVNGRKWAIAGSRSGLFIGRGIRLTSPVVICEGPTDTAALLSIGLYAIGRPSNTGGSDLVIKTVNRIKWRGDVLIFTDKDEPGSTAAENTARGAESLAERLILSRCNVKILSPPVKDARKWVQASASRRDVLDRASRVEHYAPRRTRRKAD